MGLTLSSICLSVFFSLFFGIVVRFVRKSVGGLLVNIWFVFGWVDLLLTTS